MKTLTKVLFVSLMSLFLTSSLFAQASASANSTVTASLIKGLSITSGGNIVFGDIQLTGGVLTPTITPGSASGVRFDVVGHPNRDVDVTFSTLALSNAVWAGGMGVAASTVDFVPDVDHTSDDPTYSGAVGVTTGDNIQADNTAGVGYLYLWLGGYLDITGATEPGDYTGTFTLSVAY